MPEIIIQPAVGECIDLADAKLQLRVTDTSQDLRILAFISGSREMAETICRRQMLHTRRQLILDKFPMAGSGTPLPFADTVNIPAYAIRLPHSPTVKVVSIQYLDMNGDLQTVDPAIYTVNTALEPAIITPRFGQIWPIPLPQIGAVMVTYDCGYASPIAVGGGIPGGSFKVSGPVTWQVGDTVQFYNSGGALPSPLQERTPYLIASASNGQYTVTDLAGGAVAITGTQAGSSFIGIVPDGLRNWMMLRIGSMYRNGEEVAMVKRGKVELLPYVDGLLDPYKTALP